MANERFAGIGFYRLLFFVPIGVSVPIASILWRTMFDPNAGLINSLLSIVKIPSQPFLISQGQALWCIVAIATWKGISFWMIFLWAGLQDIPQQVLEAAEIDGANRLQRFLFVTLPLMRRPLLFVLVTDTATNFLLFAIPLYTVVRSIGWLDTYQGLIGPGVANGIVIFLFRQFFAQIPRELAESARLEGASWLGILFRIYLPLSKPVVISAALLIFLFQWESFLWPLIATRSENLKVIQVALAGFEERYVTLWNELFAAAIIAALIPLIILLPLQRFYVQGVTAAATKD
ncbi:MAG: ABC transporter permease subunit [Verrucomicrobia bacterium]|nr:ABC transporter permease subunit [Verrucomicrobiota bacterium]